MSEYRSNDDPLKWLEALRTGTAAFNECLLELEKTLEAKGQSLEDIGSSADELHTLANENERKVAIRYAKFWLAKIENEGRNKDFTRLLQEQVSKYQLTPEELEIAPEI